LIKFKVTLPKEKQFDRQRFMSGLKKVGENLASRVDKTYDELTGEWNDPPEFYKTVSTNANGMRVEVKTPNLKYRFVDLGTKPHPIQPLPPGSFMVFQKDYTPVTKVQSLKSTPGGKSGDFIFAKQIDHPGSEARNFEIPINKEQIPLVIKDFYDIMEKFKAFILETEHG